jgi:aarF domain-containing kinase
MHYLQATMIASRIFSGMLLLMLLIVVVSVTGFVVPSPQKTASFRSMSTTTTEKEVQSSARLLKAKQLLEQLDVVEPPTTTMIAQDVSYTSKSEVTLPDSFWSNGHLVEGDYVTRWSRGKKVAEPLVTYDPVAAEKLLFRQPTKWLVRNFQIAFPFGIWAAGVVADYLFQKSNRRLRAIQLKEAISGLGPAIIKGGQALASRPDLLPSEYLEELQKLQDDVPRFSNQLAFATVEEELGEQFEDVFELVEQEPIAGMFKKKKWCPFAPCRIAYTNNGVCVIAASIGQVYKARLLSNGDLVALKIQRPKCEEIIALDLYVLRWWAGVYNKVFEILNRDVDLQSIIDDFGELIYREIDYVAEAANAQRFSELYAGVTDVFVPKIYSELTTSKVLTMEWVDGFRLTDSESLERYNLDRTKVRRTWCWL